jgi:predicted PurR-regulated permease PerM
MKDVVSSLNIKSLVTLTLFALCVYLLVLIRHTLLLIFIALIFSTLIEPFAKSLKKHHIPRALSALIVYLILFGIIGMSLTVLTRVVAHDLPQLLDGVNQNLNTIKNHNVVQQILGEDFVTKGNLAFLNSADGQNGGISNVFSSVSAVFGGFISFIIVLVITFYLVIQEDPLRKMLETFVPEQKLPVVLRFIERIRHKLGLWLRGQITLSLIMSFLIFVVLTLFQVKYAAVIALMAAMLEFIPYLGPILIALPAVFFAYVDGGVVHFFVVGSALVLIQQFENHILIPKIMQKAVGLNPIVSIISLIIGIQLGGVLGGVLAIPVATTLHAVLEEYMDMKKRNSI